MSHPLAAAAPLALQGLPDAAVGSTDAAIDGAVTAEPPSVNAPQVACVVEEVEAGPAVCDRPVGQLSAAVHAPGLQPAGDPHAAAAVNIRTTAAVDGAAVASPLPALPVPDGTFPVSDGD